MTINTDIVKCLKLAAIRKIFPGPEAIDSAVPEPLKKGIFQNPLAVIKSVVVPK